MPNLTFHDHPITSRRPRGRQGARGGRRPPGRPRRRRPADPGRARAARRARQRGGARARAARPADRPTRAGARRLDAARARRPRRARAGARRHRRAQRRGRPPRPAAVPAGPVPRLATALEAVMSSVRLPFAAIVLAMLPAVLDQTILSTALPTIARDLGRVTDVSWVVTAYVVAAAATTPLWGKLGDRHGRKALLQAALALFLAASAVCGLAPGITALVVARGVQGVAAGGLMSLAMAAVGDLASPRERGRYQGYIAATFAVATVAGPLLGGLLVQGPGWRWVFYVNLPVGVLALAGLQKLPAPEPAPAAHKLDGLGAALLAGATGALMLGCIWFNERSVAPLFAAGAVLGAALIARERKAADPIVPLGLLRTPAVAVACGALFLAT